MGKKLREKQAKAQSEENKLLARFSMHNNELKNQPAEVPLLDLIPEVYQKQFFRDPSNYKIKTKSHDRHKQMMEIVTYAFGRFAVPKILEKAWFFSKDLNRRRFARQNNHDTKGGQHIREGFPGLQLDKNREDFKQWYICVATGGSLYKEYLKTSFTKKEVHTFLTCPFDISLNEAVVYAVAKSAGANEGISLRIARSRLQEKSFTEFWKGVMRFFAEECPENIKQINDLLDFFQHKKNEDANFQIFGRGFTLESLLKKMKDWHWELGRIRAMGDASWQGYDIEDAEYKTKDPNYKDKELTWHFHQIKDAKSLAQEGNAMHHCVFSYKSKCVAGQCAIWSLYTEDFTGLVKKKLTIEIREDGSIVQVRGLAQRSPTGEENKMINMWAKDFGLEYTGYFD